MGFFRTAKKIVKPHVDVPRWIDYTTLSATTRYLVRNIKSLATPTKSTYSENFNEAIIRLNLSEKDILFKEKQFYWFAWMYFVVGLGVLGYGLFILFVQHSLLGSFMSCSISGVIIALAFRNRFWYFQTKTRKLGYRLIEWFVADILKKGTNNDLTPQD